VVFESLVDEGDEPDERLFALGSDRDSVFRQAAQLAGVAEQAVFADAAVWMVGGRVSQVDHQGMGSRVAGPA